MSRRTYRMIERARSMEETRHAILEAAARLFGEEGFSEVSLDDVAGEAGVARGTVYHQFGSRAGLIEALTTHAEEEAGFQRVLAAAERRDPADALQQTVVELVRFMAGVGPLFGNLRTLAVVDPDTSRMVQRKEEARRALFHQLVERADRAGIFRESAPRSRAILVALTRYEAIQELLNGRSPEQALDDARWMVSRLLLSWGRGPHR